MPNHLPDPYPASDATVKKHRFACRVCGEPFVVLDDATDGDVIPNLHAFLAQHRRCLRQVLQYGGTLAGPLYSRD
jgi:hypothetical protein